MYATLEFIRAYIALYARNTKIVLQYYIYANKPTKCTKIITICKKTTIVYSYFTYNIVLVSYSFPISFTYLPRMNNYSRMQHCRYFVTISLRYIENNYLSRSYKCFINISNKNNRNNTTQYNILCWQWTLLP